MLRYLGKFVRPPKNYFVMNRVYSNQRHPLSSFFDVPDNWGKATINAGRPWRKDELRLKSSVELHQLWYILLKERNMLMTMEEEHNRQLERMPNPERFEKVEESMENVLHVIEERNKAINFLERGVSPGPEGTVDIDHFGREVEVLSSEHAVPKEANPRYLNDKKYFSKETLRLLRLEREKQIVSKRNKLRKQRWVNVQEEQKKNVFII